MKIAIVMTGLFRTLDRCWPGMRQMFDGHELDITVVTSEPLRVAEFNQIIQPDRLLLIREPNISQYEQALPRWTDPAHHSAMIQAAKDLEVAPLVGQVECDFMCRLRTDLEILTPLEDPSSLKPVGLYLPNFNNWGGYSGQFMIGTPYLVMRHLVRANRLADYSGNPGDEHFIKWYLGDCPIKRSRIKFNLLRSDGTKTPPLYNTGGDEPDHTTEYPTKQEIDYSAIKGIPVGHRDEDDVR